MFTVVSCSGIRGVWCLDTYWCLIFLSSLKIKKKKRENIYWKTNGEENKTWHLYFVGKR